MHIADLIGKPYEDGARGPDAYDCFGLFAELCRRRGLALAPEPNPAPADGTPEAVLEAKHAAIQAAIARGEWRRLDVPEPGCAVVFRIVPPYVTHIGMVLEDCTRFINARKGANVAIEPLSNWRWRQRIAGFYAHV